MFCKCKKDCESPCICCVHGQPCVVLCKGNGLCPNNGIRSEVLPEGISLASDMTTIHHKYQQLHYLTMDLLTGTHQNYCSHTFKPCFQKVYEHFNLMHIISRKFTFRTHPNSKIYARNELSDLKIAGNVPHNNFCDIECLSHGFASFSIWPMACLRS